MCGLAGYITTQKHAKLAKSKFTDLLINGETRGSDACGLAFCLGQRRFYYFKAPIPASKFIAQPEYAKLFDKYNPPIMIGHNRAETQGDKADNNNNHPIVTKTGLMLIHNGQVWNEEEAIAKLKLKLDGKCDSEVIVRAIEHFIYKKKQTTQKAIQSAMKELRGSFACALLNAKEPNTLYIWCEDNPLCLAYHKPTGTIYFASTEDILTESLVTYESYFKGLFLVGNSKDYICQEVSKNTGYKITAKKWEIFKIETKPFASQTSDNTKSWIERGQRALPLPPSQKPIIIEAKTEADILKALKLQSREFDDLEPIKKPSEYLTELLLWRLELIQEQYSTGETESVYDEVEELVLKCEVKRIIDTLTQRQKKTKRKNIYIPTIEEVIKFGAKNPKWVLSIKNDKLFELMKKAELAEDIEAEHTQEHIPLD
jgi:predicted glutamine amidotransferase